MMTFGNCACCGLLAKEGESCPKCGKKIPPPPPPPPKKAK